MKIFLLFLIFFLSVNSWTKSEDINNFEIEGIAIGDSLLDFFDKNQIDNFLNYDEGTDLKFRISEFYDFIDIKSIKENRNGFL